MYVCVYLCMFATTLRYYGAVMLRDTLVFVSKDFLKKLDENREEYDCEQVTRSRSSD